MLLTVEGSSEHRLADGATVIRVVSGSQGVIDGQSIQEEGVIEQGGMQVHLSVTLSVSKQRRHAGPPVIDTVS